jgi:hypothetical protein
MPYPPRMKDATMRSAININTGAQLVEFEDGSIHLSYEGVNYTRDQFVPFHIFGVNSSPARHTTAAQFITGSMLAKFGDDHGKWPAMALRFLLLKDTR